MSTSLRASDHAWTEERGSRSGQQRGLAGATLATDNMVAFNANFYGTLGFNIVEGHSDQPDR
ncbi:hypothetical protein [Pantoea sp. Fr+CA_20]|uniref:hypothetical protein n=1 Tax=Pantoea sp. Fr+CA_20 TaxID=2929506 RepID=UPI0021183A7B|nr:hypothetical protein [Pantoea sp. Fr+CA_20]